MKAYLIDPFEKTITTVDYSGDHKDIYKLIDCTSFDCVTFNHNLDGLYVDDEGLYAQPQAHFILENYHQPLVNKALCLGCDAEGESKEPWITIDGLEKLIKFVDPMEAYFYWEKKHYEITSGQTNS